MASMKKRAAPQPEAGGVVRVSAREQRILDALAALLSCGIAAALVGPPGCGKSTLAGACAASRGRGVVRVHAGEAADDARALIGSHVLGASGAGVSFRWAAGPVVRAMAAGAVLVVEDVHVASAEVCAVLLSVAQSRAVLAPHGRVDAHPAFALVATADAGQLAAHHAPLLAAMERVPVPALADADVCDILRARTPGAALLLQLRVPHAAVFRLASRLANFPIGGPLDAQTRAAILLEAVDVAAGHLPRPARAAEARRIGAILSLSDAEVAALLERHPAVELSGGRATLGRVVLPARGTAAPGLARALVTDQMLERLAAAVAAGEPVLLVGGAGAGKTSAVQALAGLVLRPRALDSSLPAGDAPPLLPLTVVNMSQTSEAADLLGAYRPVAPGRDSAARLWAAAEGVRGQFVALFRRTFDAAKNASFLHAVAACDSAERLVRLMAKGLSHALSAPSISGPLRLAWDAFADDALRPLTSAARASRPAGRFAYVEGVLARAAREGTWVLLDEINLASPETLHVLGGLLERMRAQRSMTHTPLVGAQMDSQSQSSIMVDDDAHSRSQTESQSYASTPVDDGAHCRPPMDSQSCASTSVDHSAHGGSQTESQSYASTTVDEKSQNASDPSHHSASARKQPRVQPPDTPLNTPPESPADTAAVHPAFRIFACMNPGGSDVGKRVLPAGIRAAFTELWMDDIDAHRPDVEAVVAAATARMASATPVLRARMTDAYYGLRAAADAHGLVDAQRRPPLLGLRTLVRALALARRAEPLFGAPRALYEGLAMALGCALDANSRAQFVAIVSPLLLNREGVPPLPRINAVPPGFVDVEGYLVRAGPFDIASEESLEDSFLLTPSARATVAAIARAAMAGPLPVLLEGPTSAGKTSAVEYVGRRTGHRVVRVNNSGHTDVAQYVGGYGPDAGGALVFREGVLTAAVRAGDWLVLDELNLAPSDVLEALNRLLDDNRELFVPDTGETISAHPAFRLFATQNPAAGGLYGGRNALSRAFRSRFVEVAVGDIPVAEVEAILVRRAALPPSHARRLAAAYRLLQERRAADENVFAGRHAAVTLRDMFRWARRPHDAPEDLALAGYRVLAERLRRGDHRRHVLALVMHALGVARPPPIDAYESPVCALPPAGVVPTAGMRRMLCLLHEAVCAAEPVLLVGETGTGKTAACQALAAHLRRGLVTLNCHMGTDVADLLGALRPARTAGDGPAAFVWHDGPLVRCMREGLVLLLDEVSLADDSVLERLNSVLEPGRTLTLAEAGGEVIVAHPDFAVVATMNPGGDYGKKELSPALRNRFTEIWVPSIGDDADLAAIVSKSVCDAAFAAKMVSFVAWWRDRVAATPALAHWPFSLRDVVAWAHFVAGLAPALGVARAAVHAAVALFVDPAASVARGSLDVRVFAAACCERLADVFGVDYAQDEVLRLSPAYTRLNAAAESSDTPSVALGVNYVHDDVLRQSPADSRSNAVPSTDLPSVALGVDYPQDKLLNQSPAHSRPDTETATDASNLSFGIGPFVQPVKGVPRDVGFSFGTPTARASALRILRAMMLDRAVLLEGNPGVGKSAIVAALAAACGRRLVRINLSEQTDIVDLFGADMPVGGTDGRAAFAWIDGPFLAALRAGDWILLDELNLASQSVLEGLNAVLDHRGTVYIPELDRSFALQPGTRIFAAQNPLAQGGGRKGLPRSFLNRFVTVWIDAMTAEDMHAIVAAQSPLDAQVVHTAVAFSARLLAEVEARRIGAVGGPWECNLRDLQRWAALSTDSRQMAARALNVLYATRMRTSGDRCAVRSLIAECFSQLIPDVDACIQPAVPDIVGSSLCVGLATLPYSPQPCPYDALPCQRYAFEALAVAVQHAWPAILVDDHGTAGCGKSSMVRLLASLCGKLDTLVEVTLSPDTETADLLGSFEQVGSEELTFAWRDGPLVRALETGAWIVLDRANQCSPSVLDRLNALLEPNGVLVLSEAAEVVPRVVRPHLDSRIFLICSGPGELSRAMRNRGLEICLERGATIDADAQSQHCVMVAHAGSANGMNAAQIVSSCLCAKDSFAKARNLATVLRTLGPDVASQFAKSSDFCNLSPYTQFWFSRAVDHVGAVGPAAQKRAILQIVLEALERAPSVRHELECRWAENDFRLRLAARQQSNTIIPTQWRQMWKTVIAPEAIKYMDTLSSLVAVANSLPLSADLHLKLARLLPNLLIARSDPLSNTNHHAAFVVHETMKRFVAIASAVSRPLANRAMLLSLCATLRASLTWDAVCASDLQRLRNALSSMTLQTHSQVLHSVAAVHNLSLRLISNYTATVKSLAHICEAERAVAETLAAAAGTSCCSESLAHIGRSQLHAIAALFSQHDPILHHYAPKAASIHAWLQDSVAAVDAQRTLRMRLLGDDTLTSSITDQMEKGRAKLAAIELFLSSYHTHQRAEIASTLNNSLRVLDRLDMANDQQSMRTLIENARVLRETMAARLPRDAAMLLCHALDLVIIGLEMSSVSSPPAEISYPVNTLLPQTQTSLDILLRDTQLYRTAGVNLQSAMLTQVLSERYRDIKSRELERERREAQSSAAVVFKNIEDDDEKDSALAKELFSETKAADDSICVAAANVLIFNKPFASFDEAARALVSQQNTSLRQLILESRYSANSAQRHAKNIYTLHSAEECQLAVSALEPLIVRIDSLLSEFPEHDMLLTLRHHCQRFMELPFNATTTIAVLINTAETLLAKAQTWEANADRAHSTAEHTANLMALVIKWRKMELQGWRSQLDSVDETYTRQAYEDSLWLLNVLLSKYDLCDTAVVAELVKLLEQFLVSSPAGQFTARLSMLKSLSSGSSVVCPVVRQILALIVTFYESGIAARLGAIVKEHRTKIGQDMRAALVDTVWRDKTYWAVQQTVERTHRLVARQVRRYRDLLDMPVSLVLSKHGKSTDSDSSASDKARVSLSWKGMPNMDGLSTRAFNRLGNALLTMDTRVPWDAADELAGLVAERMVELSKLSSKDAVQIRQKALVNLLRILKHGGLRLSLAHDSDPQACKASHILARAAVWPGKTSLSGEHHLSRAVMRWTELLESKIHDDVGPRQADATRNAVFHLISHAVAHRKTISEWDGAANAINIAIKSILWAIDRQADGFVFLDGDSVASVKAKADELMVAARLAASLASPHGASAIDAALHRLSVFVGALRQTLSEHTATFGPRTVASRRALQLWAEVCQEMRELPLAHPDLMDVLGPLQRMVAALPSLQYETILSNVTPQDVIRDMQLAVQLVEQHISSESFPTDAEEHGIPHLFFTATGCLSIWSTLAALIGRVTSEIYGLDPASDALPEVHKMAQVLAQFAQAILNRHIALHRGMNKLSVVLSGVVQNLFERGFCRPPPQQGEESTEGQETGDGMGMADGTGEKNVSDQIEFEEQITDLMKDSPGEQEQQESEDKPTGEDEQRLEMTDDFDGQDHKDPENSDEQKKDEGDEEQPEMEDRMDDVDEPGDTKELDDGWDIPEGEQAEEKPMDYDPANANMDESVPNEQRPEDASADQPDAPDGNDLVAQEENEDGAADDKETEDDVADDNDAREEQNARQDDTEDHDQASDSAIESDAEGTQPEEETVAEEQKEDNDQMMADDDNAAEEEASGSESASEYAGHDNEAMDHEEQEDMDTNDLPSNAGGQAGATTSDDSAGQTSAAAGAMSKTASGHSRQRSSAPAQRSATSEEAVDRLCAAVAQVLADQNSAETKMEVEQGDVSAEQSAQGLSVVRSASNAPSAMPPLDVDDNAPSAEAQAPHPAAESLSDAAQQPMPFAAMQPVHDASQSPPDAPTLLSVDRPSYVQLAAETEPLAQDLCEQLRLVLEPTRCTRMRGDYRTGRRLNLRRIPSYIASSYRRDKIWLRRTRPAGRNYAVVVSIDNSRSMRREHAGAAGPSDGVRLALAALATVAQALGRLEVGSLAVVAFGSAETTRVIKSLSSTAWTADEGQAVFDALSFDNEQTDMAALLECVQNALPQDDADEWRLHLILSDGIIHDHASVVPLVNASLARRVVPVFVLLDSAVADMRHVSYASAGPGSKGTGVTMTRYLDTFPFPYYVILPQLDALPSVLAGAIRQFFETASQQ